MLSKQLSKEYLKLFCILSVDTEEVASLTISCLLFQTYNNLEETKLIILRLVVGVLVATPSVTRVGDFQVGTAYSTFSQF